MEQQLAPFQKRLRLVLAIRGAGWGFLTGASLTLTLSVVDYLFQLQCLHLWPYSIAACTLAGLLISSLRPLPLPLLAATIDHAAGLGAGLTTALELNEKKHAFASALQDSAFIALSKTSPRDVLPAQKPPQFLNAVLLLAVALGFCYIPPISQTTNGTSLNQNAALNTEQSQKLDAAATELRAKSDHEKDLRDISRETQKLARDLENEKLDLQSAFDKLGRLEERLLNLREKDEAQERLRDALKDSDILKELKQTIAEKGKEASSLVKNEIQSLKELAKGDAETAKALRQYEGAKSPLARRDAAEDLLRRLSQVKEEDQTLDPELKQSVKKLESALRNAQRDLAANASKKPAEQDQSSEAEGAEQKPNGESAVPPENADHKPETDEIDSKNEDNGTAETDKAEPDQVTTKNPKLGADQKGGDTKENDADSKDAGQPVEQKKSEPKDIDPASEEIKSKPDKDAGTDKTASSKTPEDTNNPQTDSKKAESKPDKPDNSETNTEKSEKKAEPKDAPTEQNSQDQDPSDPNKETDDKKEEKQPKEPEAREKDEPSGGLLQDLAVDMAKKVMDMGIEPPTDMLEDLDLMENPQMQEWAKSMVEKLIDSGFEVPKDFKPPKVPESMKSKEATPEMKAWQKKIAEKLLKSGFKPPKNMKIPDAKGTDSGQGQAEQWQKDFAQKLLDSGFKPSKDLMEKAQSSTQRGRQDGVSPGNAPGSQSGNKASSQTGSKTGDKGNAKSGSSDGGNNGSNGSGGASKFAGNYYTPKLNVSQDKNGQKKWVFAKKGGNSGSGSRGTRIVPSQAKPRPKTAKPSKKTVNYDSISGDSESRGKIPSGYKAYIKRYFEYQKDTKKK